MKRKSTKRKRQSPRKRRPSSEPYERHLKQLATNLDVLEKVMGLRGFLSASHRPRVRDSEIIVCFADIRGFTDYCRRLQEDSHDRKIQNFLQQYFAIFVEGLLTWRTQWDTQESAGNVTLDTFVVRDCISPTMFKNLGDGLMIVWEIPSDISKLVDGQIAREVVEAVECIEQSFYYHFRQLSEVEKDSYSELVEQLDFGIALARGHAWRLEFPHGLDYAGSVVNMTSRLLDLARPRGIIAQYLMSQALFDDRVDSGEGRIVTVTGLKGFPKGVQAWISEFVDPSQKGVSAVALGPSRSARKQPARARTSTSRKGK